MARLELSLRLLVFLALGLLASTFPVLASAQSNDITLSLGGIAAQSRTLRSPPAGSTQISADVSLGANYGHRLLHAEVAALYAEIQFVALPNRSVTPANAIVPQNYASLYVTPGLRLKVLPRARLSPWVALGGGYALYEQSAKLSNGQNTTSKFLNRGVFDFGGGLDYRLFRFFGLRGEVRDFVSGNPNLNVALSSSTQHNIVASGGISVRF
ncbi:MAG: hypothetical protein WBB89_17575 [Candidatus Acidiferrum sp.]